MPKRKDPKTPTHAEGYKLILSDKGFSGYLGVCYNKGSHGRGKPWLATYYIGRTAKEKKEKGFVYLGCFPDKVSAAVAYAKYHYERNGSPEPEMHPPSKRSKVSRHEQESAEADDGEAEAGEGGTSASLPHLKPGSIRYHIVRALLAGTCEREEIVEYVTKHSDRVGLNGGEGPRKTIMTKLVHEPRESGVPLWGKFEGTTTYSLTAAGEALRSLVGDAEDEEEQEDDDEEPEVEQELGGEEQDEEEGEQEEQEHQEHQGEEQEKAGEEEQEEDDLCCRTCGRSFERTCARATHERFCRAAAMRQTRKAERQTAAAAAAVVAADEEEDAVAPTGGEEVAAASGEEVVLAEGQATPGQPQGESILERGFERARRAAKRAKTAVTPTPVAALPSPATQPAPARAVAEAAVDMVAEGPPIPAAAEFMGVFVDPKTGRWCFHTAGVTTRGFPSALAALAACEAKEPQSGAADVLQLQTPGVLQAA